MMILEGLVSTTDEFGGPHLAPMGPAFDPEYKTFLLRPFPTSNTYKHLLRHPYGVFHITDDASLIAHKAVGNYSHFATFFEPAEQVAGFILDGSCRAYEFKIIEHDDSRERIHMRAEVLKVHRMRDFIGFNRAKHAVIEAAIIATRFHLIPAEEVEAEFLKLSIIVSKTGGPAEILAMDMLQHQWEDYQS